MAEITTIIEQVKELQFELQKAEFNDEPTEPLQKSYTDLTDELAKQLEVELLNLLPKQLPLLTVNKSRLLLDEEAPQYLRELLENISLHDDSDETTLLKLDGAKSEHQGLLNLIGIWYIYHDQAEAAAGYFRELTDKTKTGLYSYNLAYALVMQKVFTPALEYLESSDDVDQALIEHNKAVIYDYLGRYAEANEHFQKAIEMAEEPETSLFNWGISTLSFDKTKEAQLILTRLEKLDNEYPGLQLHLGEISARLGDYQAAVLAFQNALQQEPDNLNILEDLATASLMADQFEEAINYFEKYLTYAKSVSIYNNLGAAYLKIQQYEQAVEAFEAALELQPQHKQSRNNLKIAKSYLA